MSTLSLSSLLSQFALGFKAAHLEGVELKHMGQQLVGQYPIHFHLAGDVDEKGGYDPPTYIRDLSIHHTFSRCVTVHGSNGLLVSRSLLPWDSSIRDGARGWELFGSPKLWVIEPSLAEMLEILSAESRSSTQQETTKGL